VALPDARLDLTRIRLQGYRWNDAARLHFGSTESHVISKVLSMRRGRWNGCWERVGSIPFPSNPRESQEATRYEIGGA